MISWCRRVGRWSISSSQEAAEAVGPTLFRQDEVVAAVVVFLQERCPCLPVQSPSWSVLAVQEASVLLEALTGRLVRTLLRLV
jgi:hypothetical protein